MYNSPTLIEGVVFDDPRGWLRAFNDFDMAQIKRMYQISPADIKTIRAWQYHKDELKVFQALNGEFLIKVIKLKEPELNEVIAIYSYRLDARKGELLVIPGGHANGIRAVVPNSILQVFSDKTLEESKRDDIRITDNTFKTSWEL